MTFLIPAILSVFLEAEDFGRFPPLELCDRFYQAASTHVIDLKNMQSMAGGWFRDRLQIMIEEAELSMHFWNQCYMAQWPNSSGEHRRDAAMEMRRLIGHRNYIEGRWPEPIPSHHIRGD